MDELPIEQQTLVQKKVAFSNSPHIEAVLAILKDCCAGQKLVGETEFETVKNAITMDAQAQMIIDFVAALDRIKKGELNQVEL